MKKVLELYKENIETITAGLLFMNGDPDVYGLYRSF